jgi:Cellulase (glycosyl hydrolase family 5)
MKLLSRCFSCAMRRMSLVLLPVVLLFGVLSAPAQKPPADVTSVSVSNNLIDINGAQGTLNGFTFIGIANTTACADPTFATANSDWVGTPGMASELQHSQGMTHANTVRLQVALDLLYEPGTFSSTVISNYIITVANAVAYARSKGFAVIVSMQWEPQASGTSICDGTKAAPGDYGATLTGNPTTDHASLAWDALLKSPYWTSNTTYTSTAVNFLTDTGVLLEIYNEPSMGSKCGTPTDWADWHTPLQDLVNYLRNTDGAKNILVVPALSTDKTLDGSVFNASNGGISIMAANSVLGTSNSLITDTLSTPQLAYAVHPYPSVTSGSCNLGFFGPEATGADQGDTDWYVFFGKVAQTMPAPVIITEWFDGAVDPTFCWDSSNPISSPVPFGYSPGTTFFSPTIGTDFITFLKTGGPDGSPLSLAGGWTFDIPAYFVQDFTDFDQTTMNSSFACGSQVTGTDGNPTYEGPGNDVGAFFNSY